MILGRPLRALALLGASVGPGTTHGGGGGWAWGVSAALAQDAPPDDACVDRSTDGQAITDTTALRLDLDSAEAIQNRLAELRGEAGALLPTDPSGTAWLQVIGDERNVLRERWPS